ncbi:MAG TPA: FAD-linked oxidase C-terminal domain-containing protein [Solirubrobacterales bacterium]|nr:FAD-linked oxidase C-terminal domain-containing protein [Solirubrobacterales bacterium]
MSEDRRLALELSREVRGEVRFSPGSRALYANDASVYRQMPIGVVVPRRAEDVLATLEICRRHGAPIGARGCGTGLAGQTVNEAVMIDFSKYMNELVELDPGRRRARVQPGLVLDDLRDAAEEHDLTFGPDPATHSRCTLGGMIGNNSCGTHSIIAGVTADNVESLDVVLYDGTRLRLPSWVGEKEIEWVISRGGREGEIYARLRELRDRYAALIRERFPDIPRRVSGFNLERLLPENGFNLAAALVGTEGTCALVLEAECRLIPSPQHRSLVLLGYEDPPTAADQVPRIMEFEPIALETFDRRLVDNELRKGFKRHPELLPDGDAWLLVEFGADSEEEADGKAEEMLAALEGEGGKRPAVGSKLYEDAKQIEQIWEIREGGVGNSKMPGEHPGWPSWEDAAVPPERTGEYLRDLEALCDKHGRKVAAFFGHVGHGCIHTRIDWDFLTPDGVANYRAFMEDAAELVGGKYGGSLSGEHGDGQARAELLDRMFGAELVGAFAEFKAIFDPDGRMNPGKVVDPNPLDANLRTGPDYRTHDLSTTFRFPDDDGSFGEAVERCFGVGACRDQSGTMCPSYQVTLEEKHSTRGRARLLFEMMRRDSLQGGWRNEEVKEALDLCLACKGCKHECPVRVDMATYKAEFLSHYWRRRMRPRQAYALGLIPWEARLASRLPRLANLMLQREPLGRLGRRAVGVAEERKPPAFAVRTFKSWFAARRPGRKGLPAERGRVLLWPDTFNNHFHPEVAIAAVEALEATGFEVIVPTVPLCCGRPLYDYGMLRLARRQLRRVLDALAGEIERGTPLIALEPSCGAVFRDELLSLFPDDPQAKRLARMTSSLGELLAREDGVELPRFERRALVHLHCHQKATSDTDCDLAVLERLGVDAEVLDSGCCGLAGSFGYEAGEHYEVSMKAAERALMPAIREAEPGTLVIADGFSCRSQIEHCGEPAPLHLAQVLEKAVHGRASGHLTH